MPWNHSGDPNLNGTASIAALMAEKTTCFLFLLVVLAGFWTGVAFSRWFLIC